MLDLSPIWNELLEPAWWFNALIALLLGVLANIAYHWLETRPQEIRSFNRLSLRLRLIARNALSRLGGRASAILLRAPQVLGPYLRLSIQALLILLLFSIVSSLRQGSSSDLPTGSRLTPSRQQRNSIRSMLRAIGDDGPRWNEAARGLVSIGAPAFQPLVDLSQSASNTWTEQRAFLTAVAILRDSGNPGAVEFLMRQVKSNTRGARSNQSAADASLALLDGGYETAPRTFRDSLASASEPIKRIAALVIGDAALRGKTIPRSVARQCAEILKRQAAPERLPYDEFPARDIALVALRFLLQERMIDSTMTESARFALWGDRPDHGIVIDPYRMWQAPAPSSLDSVAQTLLRSAEAAGSDGIAILLGAATPMVLDHERWAQAMDAAEALARIEADKARGPLLRLWSAAETSEEEERAFRWVRRLCPTIPCGEMTTIRLELELELDARGRTPDYGRWQSKRLRTAFRLVASTDTCYYRPIRPVETGVVQ